MLACLFVEGVGGDAEDRQSTGVCVLSSVLGVILRRFTMNPQNILRDNPLKNPRGNLLAPILPTLQAPLVRTPITDWLGNLLSAQEGPTFCANIEMLMLNCLDQYGYNRGVKMCGGYMQDMEECRSQFFELMRVNVMQEERRRQYRDGKRQKEFEECPPHH